MGAVVAWELFLLVAALGWQSVLEYAWHRLMHTRWCYTRMHKYHHHYKVQLCFFDRCDGDGSCPSTNLHAHTHT